MDTTQTTVNARQYSHDDDSYIRDIARSLNCLSEADFIELAGITYGTAKAWRNRGRGPQAVLLGNRYYYPLSEIKRVIEQRTSDAETVAPDVLV